RLSSRAVERQLGVSGAQLFVLQHLAEEGAQSIAELARRTVTDQSSVSVVVSRLVDRGLVTRRASKEDARRAEISLTEAGRAILSQGSSEPAPAQARLVDAIGKLPPEERSVFS